jgi:hypothetical protein
MCMFLGTAVQNCEHSYYTNNSVELTYPASKADSCFAG